MQASEHPLSPAVARTPLAHRMTMLIPAAIALAYPYVLQCFHFAAAPADAPGSAARSILAALSFLLALATPLIALAFAVRMSATAPSSLFRLRARRLTFLAIAAPPMFVFAGVAIGLLHVPVHDKWVWTAAWLAGAAYVCSAGNQQATATTPAPSTARWRVAHGVSALLITGFVVFHLGNHLLGWWGPDVHAAVMRGGRSVYRLPWVEAALVGVLLFQAFSGARLAWRWSAVAVDGYRALQIGSGVYLAAFIVAHLNSALVSARAVRHIETDWAWASGAPDGLIYDAWNIRLVPHYAFGVFFVLAHLCAGLRQVLLAHGVGAAFAQRLWLAGLLVSALISAAIMSGLCGARW